MEKERCSYCKGTLGSKYSFNSIFVTPTIYKCRRWHCNLLKKMKIYTLYWEGDIFYRKPIKKMLFKLSRKILASKINF